MLNKVVLLKLVGFDIRKILMKKIQIYYVYCCSLIVSNDNNIAMFHKVTA